MFTGTNLLLVLVACTLMCTTTYALSKRPADTWVYYHFDGVSFKAGPTTNGGAFIAVREHVQPIVLLKPSSNNHPIALPEGAGAIAGVSYIQTSGGKLVCDERYVSSPRTPLQISSVGTAPVTIQSDDHGYFMVVLAAGTYSIGSGSFAVEILVKRGITSLVPLRTGKRMVD